MKREGKGEGREGGREQRGREEGREGQTVEEERERTVENIQ